MPDTPYVPPKVWTHDAPSGGKFASINAPTAGAREEKVLPVGKHPLQLYSLATPNGVKASIMLEELLAAGHLSTVSGHGALDEPDGVFVRITPDRRVHTYGIGVSTLALARDPLHVGARTVEL